MAREITNKNTGNHYWCDFDSVTGTWDVRRNEEIVGSGYRRECDAAGALERLALADHASWTKQQIIARLDECGPATLAEILAMISPSS